MKLRQTTFGIFVKFRNFLGGVDIFYLYATIQKRQRAYGQKNLQ